MNKILLLIVLNMLYYINNFLYVFVKINFELDNFFSFWAFSPFFFILFTTFIMEDTYRQKVASIKRTAIIDVVLRISSLIINYKASGFGVDSPFLKLLISLEIIIMLFNIYIEIKMYNKITKLDNDISNNINKQDFNYYKEFNKHTIKNIASQFGLCKIIFWLICILTGSVMRLLGEKYIVLFFIIISTLFIFYLYIVFNALSSFYNSNVMKIYIRDNFTFLISIIILFVSEGIFYINTSSYNFAIWLIASLFLVPTISTQRVVSDKFNELHK